MEQEPFQYQQLLRPLLLHLSPRPNLFFLNLIQLPTILFAPYCLREVALYVEKANVYRIQMPCLPFRVVRRSDVETWNRRV